MTPEEREQAKAGEGNGAEVAQMTARLGRRFLR